MRQRLTLHLAAITAAIAILNLDRDDPNVAAELRCLEHAAERLIEECSEQPAAA
jgi:hypothetical protein